MNTANRYKLEIYESKSVSRVWMDFDSDLPFQAIHVGDLINTSTWPNATSRQMALRVISVEYVIWADETGLAKHKLCVFTQEVERTEALLLRQES